MWQTPGRTQGGGRSALARRHAMQQGARPPRPRPRAVPRARTPPRPSPGGPSCVSRRLPGAGPVSCCAVVRRPMRYAWQPAAECAHPVPGADCLTYARCAAGRASWGGPWLWGCRRAAAARRGLTTRRVCCALSRIDEHRAGRISRARDVELAGCRRQGQGNPCYGAAKQDACLAFQPTRAPHGR